jgi:antitoxin CptB
MLAPSELSKLKWRCRRGMLENDLLIQRFFSRHESALSVSQAQGLARLMELPDPQLLDLLLARSEPVADLDCSEVHEVLALMRIDPTTERH